MNGDPYVDGGVRFLAYADAFFAGIRDLPQTRDAQGRPRQVVVNVRVIVNGNQSPNDPGHDAAQAAACDKAVAGQAGGACPAVANTLLGAISGATGKGVVPRTVEDVMVHQLKMDSVYRLYHDWKDALGPNVSGSFKYTYIANSDLAHPPAGSGLIGPCQTPASSNLQFDPTFQACLYQLGLYRGARGEWTYTETR
jgi:hypothetical protein